MTSFLDTTTQIMVDRLETEFEANDIIELLLSAQLNCEQLWKFAPHLQGNAAYALTVVQIRTAIKMMEARDAS